jgi:hypothetical protein
MARRSLLFSLAATVLERVCTHPARRIAELLPDRWRIHQATCRRLREMILRSPHFASDNGSSHPPYPTNIAKHRRPQVSSRQSGEVVAIGPRIVDPGIGRRLSQRSGR